MTTNQASGRRGLAWAIIGGLVLIAGIVAIIVSSTLSSPSPTGSPGGNSNTPSPGGTESAGGEFVDPAVSERGWVPEPITTDPETYIRAALEAASTFDTTLSTREEWLDYLDSWFTPDTRYTSEADQQSSVDDAQVELRTGVVLPQEEWDSLAREDGRVVAKTSGDVIYVAVSDDASGDMSIGTSDVTLTFTRSDGDGGETAYEEPVRVSVQVLCGPASVPTLESAQQAGDCKVVRYFTEPLEP
ncbi:MULTISPECIES: hypothetical protein [Micrococcales]|uniref:Uncharacterized protein n=1 Tax=Paenarthrobacter ureafaciens TaxID=37931 RepID=A0AAX3EJ40_PAEUR|nr:MULTISPECIES: hypothetical protein [Micrococcales]NKR13441.1 hypothetical protein [Arthrobacter sp. M5]NKR15252.1 hypothetical protein [Arthrobacter sp. M6]OEH61742.1 hypothetical protein A5N17_13115 [Arthrobacter sp. D2]MDO5862937.1 hypothetical protein [Paenarthrobacter sp. SD-2]MDO5874006.1 hypothetical protein [Paenarthrobacter sp. SD-1]